MSSGMILTNAGRTLLARALTGVPLKFTRAFTGDGSLNSKDPATLTNLISARQELPIQSMNTSQTGTCEVVLEMSNAKLTTGYFVREYGLFAQDPDNPTREILYSYANKGTEAGYMEAYNGVDFINHTLSLITVVDTAPNITAVINNSNAYVTTTKLDARFANLYAEGVTPLGFWTYSPAGDDRLRPLTLEQTKRVLFGAADIGALVSRIERLEDNQAQILLSQEMAELYPDYSHYIIEDFKNINQIDNFVCDVTSIVAGDDSLDCNPIDGMIPGSFYTVSDGINSEVVQVESISLENNIQRVILKSPVKNSYILDACQIFRSNALFGSGQALGPNARKILSWAPGITWRGQNENTEYTAALNSTLGNSNAFTISGDISLTADGFISLGA